MSTPAPRYVCPRCRATFESPLRYCQQCGADMLRASALELAARREGMSEQELHASGSHQAWTAAAERRVSASAQTWLGRVVDGRYRVMEVVGRGGMGVVYKVEHVRMGKIAAMKVLHQDLAEDPDVVRRFEREAAAVSRLQHPNTVQVFDFGTSSDALYLIMELVRGQDLAHIIERDGPLPFARAAPLLGQICGALGEAHELGIVHRDLKPENVLITRTTGGRDFAKVLDFGLAKLGAREQSPETTDRAQIVGTPYFMAPEQIRGDDVDGRADVYAMGALTYTLLTGKPPFTAKSAVGVLTKHLTAEVVAPSVAAPDAGLTPEIDEIVVRALAKDPAERWQTIAEMAAALEEVWGEQVGDASPTNVPRISRRHVTEDDDAVSGLHLKRSDLDDFEASLKRWRWMVSIGATLFGLAIVALAVWWIALRPAPLHTAEVERNDDDDRATRIGAGTPVTGFLGKRISRNEPDRDVFEVVWSGHHMATVRVTGIPNLDLAITLRDAQGTRLAGADEAAVGGGEIVRRWHVEGPLFVEVTERLASPQAWPTENVSDAYTLSVTDEDDDPALEHEPNGNAPDASPLAPGTSMRGWLDARGDVDVLRWDGPAGPVTVEVTADKALPLRWLAPDGKTYGPGKVKLTLAEGAVLRLERTDPTLPHDQPLPGADLTWSVTITPAK